MAKLQSYAMSVALTKLQHKIITSKSGQKCIVIPIDDNHLTLKEDAVYMQTDIVTMDSEDTNGNWGFQVQKLPSDIWKSLGAEKAKEIKLPYFGNLKIFQKTNNNDSSGAIDVDLEDDLPY